MTPEPRRAETPIPVERLTQSFRFDAELAEILTQFQYQADGIDLTAAATRPVPAVNGATDGITAVFDAAASLVFVCYDARGHQIVNPIETALIKCLATAVADSQSAASETATATASRVGVVTPHNAQRGAVTTALPADQTVNTVERYQGGERDVMIVSGTVSDPGFARREEGFLLDPRRLLVAVSRSRLVSVIVCSSTLLGMAPSDSDRLADGPVWARLFSQAVGRGTTPVWNGSLGEFIGDQTAEHATVPVRVYPSSIDSDSGDQ